MGVSPTRQQRKRLGNPRLPEAAARGTAALEAAAGQRAANLLPIIRELQASGIRSCAGIAAALSTRNVPTAFSAAAKVGLATSPKE